MSNTETLRVRQDASDTTIPSSRFGRLRAGMYLADGVYHGGGEWTWTRVRVVANDTRSKVIVVRFPDGEYSAGAWHEFDMTYADWEKVCDRPAIKITTETWAA